MISSPPFFMSHPLQFGFKSGSSTSLSTGIVKCIVSSTSTIVILCLAVF